MHLNYFLITGDCFCTYFHSCEFVFLLKRALKLYQLQAHRTCVCPSIEGIWENIYDVLSFAEASLTALSQRPRTVPLLKKHEFTRGETERICYPSL